jgi:hypothetical protein
MTNREQGMETMFAALKQELAADSTAYAGNADFEDEATKFNTSLTDHNNKKTAAHADNSGFSQDKLNQKIVLSNMASNYSGKSYVKFVNLDMLNLAEQLNTEPSDYRDPSDGQCLKLSKEAYKLMNDNLAILSPTNTITAAMLVSFKNEIDKFELLQGSSETVHAVSPQLTQEYKDSFKPLLKIIDHLKMLGRDYKTSNPGFYDRLMASTVIPTINVHHTYVEVYVKGKDSGGPIEGMLFTLSNCNKTGTSNWEGNAKLEEVKKGTAILRGETAGKVRYMAHIVIKGGATNHYDVVIEGE